MRCPRAGIDLDGVVYQWSPTARSILKAKFGVEITESETWDWIKDHTTPEQWAWLWTDGLRHGLFWKGAPYQGAIWGLKVLGESNDLVVITTRPRAARTDTLLWLACMDVGPKEVHFLNIGEKKSSIPCDWYVDDNLDNVRDLLTTGRPVYIFDQPWNRQETPPGAIRVVDWAELVHLKRKG